MVHKHRVTIHEAKLNFVNSNLLGVHNGQTPHFSFSAENWYQLNQYMNSQNKKFPMLTLQQLAFGIPITQCDGQNGMCQVEMTFNGLPYADLI